MLKYVISSLFFTLFMTSAHAAPQVVVSIKPLHSLVAGVMGGTGEPELLVSGNVSPHEFQFKPSQMKMLQNASVVFYIDDAFEGFLHNALEALPGTIRKVSATSGVGITFLPQRRSGAWEAHEHAHEHLHHEGAKDDMHIWLDPENAQKIVALIAQELSALFPQNKEIYQANAHALTKEISALDLKLKTDLSGLGNRSFIVFHDATQYLERRYGLNAVGSITFDPSELPSPARIKQVREKLQQTNAVCVFREPFFSGRLVDAVISGSNARSGLLDPEGANLEPGKNLYFALMQGLARSIRECLGKDL